MKIKKCVLFVIVASIIFMIGANSVSAENAIMWDSMVFENGYSNTGALKWESISESLAWGNRANWQQVSYGKTGAYNCKGSCILENGNLLVLFPYGYKNSITKEAAQPLIGGLIGNTIKESPAFYGKNILYDPAYPSIDQWWDYYPELYTNPYTIIKNQPDEIIVKREAGSKPNKNIAQYRIKANTGWIEKIPLTSGTYRLGLHDSPNKMAASPPTNEAGNDLIVDKDYEGTKAGLATNSNHPVLEFFVPDSNKYALYQLRSEFGSDYAMIVVPKDMPSSNLAIYVDYAWESSTPYMRLTQITGDSRIDIANNAMYFGVVNQLNVFKHYSPNTAITSGGSFTTSPVSIAGRWRISGRIGSNWYTQTRDVSAGTGLVFTAPVSGTLSTITYYLYDRNSQTPANINTPQDIYRSIINPSPSTPIPTPVQTPSPTYTPIITPTPTPISTQSSDVFGDLINYITQMLSSLFKA